MPTLVSTVGSATANTFATLSQFETYCDGRLNASAFTSASEDDQSRALIEATKELTLLEYVGQQTSATQALAWPRSLAPNPAGRPYLTWYGTSEIPQRILDATCEYALQFLKASTTDIAAEDTTRSIKRERVDVIETEYTEPFQRTTGIRRYPRVWALVAPLLCSASPNVVPVLRG